MNEILQRQTRVKAEWIDYNGHMNVANYVLVFDHSTDALLETFELGEAYRQRENKSFFVVESHVTYENEVKKDDLLVVKSKLLGYDTKRLQIFHEMFLGETGEKCATNEIMVLHVDMGTRKTTEIAERFKPLLQTGVDGSLANGFPDKCGRAITKLLKK
ncbi:thioesterase family protein [Terasakiella sp.]|uniref:thioesterase family protein n=1 Tax=Terasakiella sp. TaxID=2034861 RepID=UPI003AA8F5F3